MTGLIGASLLLLAALTIVIAPSWGLSVTPAERVAVSGDAYFLWLMVISAVATALWLKGWRMLRYGLGKALSVR